MPKKNFNKFGHARYGTSGHKNPILKPIYNIYFCHITNIKWSRKCFFWIFFHYLGLFLYNPYYILENLPPPLKIYHSVQVMCFRNHRSIGNILGGCRILGFDQGKYKHRLTTPGWFSLNRSKSTNNFLFIFCIGPIIRIGQEIQCLPYAGFFCWKSTNIWTDTGSLYAVDILFEACENEEVDV